MERAHDTAVRHAVYEVCTHTRYSARALPLPLGLRTCSPFSTTSGGWQPRRICCSTLSTTFWLTLLSSAIRMRNCCGSSDAAAAAAALEPPVLGLAPGVVEGLGAGAGTEAGGGVTAEVAACCCSSCCCWARREGGRRSSGPAANSGGVQEQDRGGRAPGQRHGTVSHSNAWSHLYIVHTPIYVI